MVNPGLNQRGDSDHNEGQPLIAECGDPKEMVELLPCPFCGGRAKTVYVMRAWSVTCECGAGIDEFDAEAEAIAAWNTRAEPLVTPSEPAEVSAALNQADREKLVRAVVERCAEEVERVAQDFLSPEYACPQPIGSVQERFACNTAASAIRSLNIDDLVKETGR